MSLTRRHRRFPYLRLCLCGLFALLLPAADSSAGERVPLREWMQTASIPAREAHQAAAADEKYVYAINNTSVARYDRRTGERLAVSSGKAEHLNSGFFWDGKIFCAHSNYPKRPEQSDIKVLDLESMQLSTFKEFGNYDGGSLTWAVREGGHWWCNFAFYREQNHETFLVKFGDDWNELGRWTYPPEVIEQLGRYSLSGGVWREGLLLVSGHDDPLLFGLRLPQAGSVLEYVELHSIPITGQGFAADPVTGGMVGINRKERLIIFAER